MANTNMPYNGVYNALVVDLTVAHTGDSYTFFVDPNEVDNRTYIGYIRVLRVDDVSYISLGEEGNDQIPMEAGSWFTIPYHVGLNTLYVFNSASTVANAILSLLVTVG